MKIDFFRTLPEKICMSYMHSLIPQDYISVGWSSERSWEVICNAMLKAFKQTNKDKDTIALNFSSWKPATEKLLRLQIGHKMLANLEDDKKRRRARAFDSDIKRTEEAKRLIQKNVLHYNRTPIIRKKEFLLCVNGLIYDIDDVTIEEAKPWNVLNRLDKLTVSYIAYSSFNNRAIVDKKVKSYKYRVVIPFSSRATVDLARQTFFRFIPFFSSYDCYVNNNIDNTSHQPFRFFYVPSSPILYSRHVEKFNVDSDIDDIDFNKPWIRFSKFNRGIDPKKFEDTSAKLVSIENKDIRSDI